MAFPAKCHCQTCNGWIEFEPSQVGTSIPCPHCGCETTLFVTQAAATTTAPRKAKQFSLKAVLIVSAILIGIVLAAICAEVVAKSDAFQTLTGGLLGGVLGVSLAVLV